MFKIAVIFVCSFIPLNLPTYSNYMEVVDCELKDEVKDYAKKLDEQGGPESSRWHEVMLMLAFPILGTGNAPRVVRTLPTRW